MNSNFRQELKYVCSYDQMEHLQSLLASLLSLDEYQSEKAYHITSLYFDTQTDRFLSESLNGTPQRKKYRLRRYNSETEQIKFESKTSFFQLKRKNFTWLNRQKALDLLNDMSDMAFSDDTLLEEFYCLKQRENIIPKIVVEYDRTALTDKDLNIRVTFDKNISATNSVEAFFDNNPHPSYFLFEKKMGIVEVKFDTILPSYIKKILNQEDLTQTSFSKYDHCRIMNKPLY